MEKILGLLSLIMGSAGYTYLITNLIRGNADGLSLATFGLWSALAWITVFTMINQKVNPTVLIIYGLGATITSIILLARGKYGWSGYDTLVAVLVAICIVLWLISGSKAALIFSVVAAVVAAIPLIRLAWEAPAVTPIIANASFLASNVLAFSAAKKWTMQDRLPHFANIIVTSLLVIPWLLR